MCGEHLCERRLSATYISSNRYMHIILFYFRLFILFSPGLPFTLTSLVLHPDLLRSSFVLPSSFIRPSFSLSTGLSLLPLRHSGSLLRHFLCSLPSFQFSSPSFPALIPRHSRLDRESLSFPLLSPLSFQLASPRLLQRSPSPPFPLLPPSFQLSSPSFPARPGIPCHPEPVLLVILSASEGSSPTDFSIIISKHTKI